LKKEVCKDLDKTKRERKIRFRDFLVVLFCLSGVAASLYLFWVDLYQIIQPQNSKSVGVITYDNTGRWLLGNRVLWKNNAVQRQQENRVLWERLLDDSPVYSGDLIRVAGTAEAVLRIENKQITLSENTQIRITVKKGLPEIEFISGSLTIDGDPENEIVVTVNGKKMAALPSSEGATGKVFQVVNEIDPESTDPAVTVTSPRPGKRYFKNGPQPPDIVFEWNRFNIEQGEALQLEIAGNRNFTRIVRETTAFDTAVLPCDTGVWYWRLSYRGTSLADGRITVTDAAGPALFRPAEGSEFRYQSERPDMYFRWSEIDGASFYLLEVGETQDFDNPQIKTVHGTSFVNPGFGPRTWFWRVQPVFFPDDHKGGFSSVASFSIKQNDFMEAPALTLPAQGETIAADRDLYFSWTGNKEAISYTIQIFANQGLGNMVKEQTVRDNFYAYEKNHGNLTPEQYYWFVHYTNQEGNDSPHSDVRFFTVTEEKPVLRPVFPPDNYTIATSLLSDIDFKWDSNLHSQKRFQVSAQSDFLRLEIDEQVPGNSFRGFSLPPGDWYWRVVTANAGTANAVTRQESFATPARHFSLVNALPAPVLELPLSGSRIQPDTGQPVNFSWRPVDGAKHYHFKLFATANQDNPVYERNFFQDTRQPVLADTFAEGDYHWTVQAVVQESSTGTRQTGNIGTGRFTLRKVFSLTLESPTHGTELPGFTALRQQTVFRWSTGEEVGKSRFVLSRNSDPRQGRPAVEIHNPDRTVRLDRLEEGLWYWTVEAWTPEGFRINPKAPRQLRVLPIPSLITLESPAAGAELPGLTVLRQQTVFRWSTGAEVGRSRFVLSRNSDPLQGRPAVEIPVTGRTVSLDRLGEGVWYWTVEAWTPDGIRINARAPRQLRVLPIPLLPEAGNRRPSGGHRMEDSELRELWAKGGLVFSWAAVNGANAYIFTLFQETDNGRKQIVRTDPPVEQTKWTLNDISLLAKGSFVWQVEAVNRRNGTVEQRGRIGENTLYVDVHVPRVETGEGKVVDDK
jgi:hypothetical protein